jgi:nucleotide-binding universal stress UspA family protein
MIPIKTILHPTDFSKPSEHALRFACALARDYQARLVLLHVVEPPVYYGEPGMIVPLSDEFYDHLKERLEHLVSADCGVPFTTMLVEGNASKEILRVASERACDLIVLGTHGRTGLSRVLLGSVAEVVTRHSRVPVLTLRNPALLDVPREGPQETVSGSSKPAAARSSRSVLVF